MSEFDLTTQVISVIEACAPIITVGAVVYAIKAYYSSKEKRQFDLSKTVQDDMLNFNRELAVVKSDDDEGKALLYERLFNSLEWLGFLINEKQITNNKIRQYFKMLVIDYYEKTFLKTDFITDEVRSNPNKLKEFKKLYQDYKSGVYD
jgi:hypothetical protein